MSTIWEGAATSREEAPAAGRLPGPAPEAPPRPWSGEWIEMYRGSIYWVAREYRHLGVPFEDLLAEGIVGLLEAASRFDPTRGVKFASYATWWIRKRICEIVMRQATLVRLPRYRLRHLSRIRAAERDAAAALGRPPTNEEIARLAGVEVREVEFLSGLAAREISLGAMVNEDTGLCVEDTLAQHAVGSPDAELLREDRQALVDRILRRLPRRECEILSLRFGLDGRPPRTLAQVGKRLGLSRERVRQVEGRAILNLRRMIDEGRDDGRRGAHSPVAASQR